MESDRLWTFCTILPHVDGENKEATRFNAIPMGGRGNREKPIRAITERRRNVL